MDVVEAPTAPSNTLPDGIDVQAFVDLLGEQDEHTMDEGVWVINKNTGQAEFVPNVQKSTTDGLTLIQ